MPITRGSHEAGRTAVTSTSHNRNPRPSLRVQDLAVGCVVWLPCKEDDDKTVKCIRELCCFNRELNEGGFNHPVVVLEVREDCFGHTLCSIAEVRLLYLISLVAALLT
jgi:hypothetical protein